MKEMKATTILNLALELRDRRTGMCIGDIECTYGISRSTVERWLKQIDQLFELEIVRIDDKNRKYWRAVDRAGMERLIEPSADELANLEFAAAVLRQVDQNMRADTLEALAHKVRKLMPSKTVRRTELDVEALLAGEGFAMRPGPRPNVVAGVMDNLRQAIKGGSVVRLSYQRRGAVNVGSHIIQPLGFLFGHRHYLVARVSDGLDEGGSDKWRDGPPWMFVSSRIKSAALLDRMFPEDEDFSLPNFAAQSFGIYQEEPFDVVWRFTPEAAAHAEDFQFHPSQSFEYDGESRLIVRFRAGALLEMAWHLCMWGDQVEVLEPPELVDLMAQQQNKWPALP